MAASQPAGAKMKVKRSTRLLQLCALTMLIVGCLCLIPGLSPSSWGILVLVTGGTGSVGLSFTWHRALVLFTMLSFATSVLAIGTFVDFASKGETNPIPWIFWVIIALAAVPAAVLSSTMHLLRVWTSAPLVTDQTAPLVDPVAASSGAAARYQRVSTKSGGPPMENRHLDGHNTTSTASRPVWPPPQPVPCRAPSLRR